MKMGAKIEAIQLVAAIVLLGLALAKILWSGLAPMMDTVFVTLVLVGLGLLILPLKTIRSLKAGGVELSLDAAHVQGAVDGLNLDRIEDAKLKMRLQRISRVLPTITCSKLLWIDDRPENVIGERRLLRALGVTVVSATSSDQAREILGIDQDFDLIVTDVQRIGDTHKITGGEPIHDGVNFIVWLRTKSDYDFVRKIPIIFYAAYDWPRLVEFTLPVRGTLPEPGISNSAADFVPKVLLALADSREMPIQVPREKPGTVARSSVHPANEDGRRG
jgi:CheY-like chemotaxis protein